MSAVSEFMEALKQATHPERPPEPKTSPQGLENNCKADHKSQMLPSQDVANSHSPGSMSQIQHNDAMAERGFNQKPIPDDQKGQARPRNIADIPPSSIGFGIPSAQSRSMPTSSASDAFTKPQLPARDSLDDLFSDTDSDQPGESTTSMTNNIDNEEADYQDYDDIKEPTWASDGELFSTRQTAADPRSYDPNEPPQFHQEITRAQDFGSPQISPDSPFHPNHNPSSTRTHPNVPVSDHEHNKPMSEEEQIAYFSDKPFRKALREVEPALSKQQQHYAWKNGYQVDVCGEQQPQQSDINQHKADADFGEEGTEDEANAALELNRNPPYHLGLEPVGLMDGVPIFADIDPKEAREEIDRRMEEINSREQARERKASDRVSQEDQYKGQMSRSSSSGNTDQECVRPFNPFSHAPAPTATAPQSEMAKRERMLQSSFSQALQALEENNAERMARESEVDEAHLARLRALSPRRDWAMDDGDDRDNEPPAGGRDREGSPDPPYPPTSPATESWTSIIEVHNSNSSSSNRNQSSASKQLANNHDDSFATAFESPARPPQWWGSETVSEIHARLDAEARAEYAHQHHTSSSSSSEEEEDDDEDDEDEDGDEAESISPHQKIPGLTHLRHHRASEAPIKKRNASLKGLGGPALPPRPSTPPSTSHAFHADEIDIDIRKSIEPETPRHLLSRDRDCTPAFEDRSPSPSPKSLARRDAGRGDGDVDVDAEMEEASPLAAAAGPVQRQPRRPRSSNKKTTNERHRSRSHSRPPTKSSLSKPPIPQTSTSTVRFKPATKPPRPSSRRKSAVQGSHVKVEKPRSASRKVATSAAAAAELDLELELGVGSMGEGKSMGEEKGKGKSIVKEAVERIEASVRMGEEGGERGRRKKKGGWGEKLGKDEGTPPTRRSRRLIERRGKTPELEGEGDTTLQ